MPDFTIEIYQQCQQNERYYYEIGGYRQSWDFFTGPTCECKGFKYRKTCKHVREMMANRCTWHEAYDEPQTPEQAESKICPRCGGPTMHVKVAV